MKLDRESMRLYLVTDRSWLGEDTLEQQVDLALQNGVTFLQLREKELDREAFLALAGEMKALSKKAGIPFVINDDVAVCMESGADGVHVGQGDMAARNARALLGEDKIIGVSVRTVEQAKKAAADGADYLGVGAVFGTTTKLDAGSVNLKMLSEICAAVDIPVVAIGGIHAGNLMELAGSGADGVAVISAVFASDDIGKATRNLRELSDRMVSNV